MQTVDSGLHTRKIFVVIGPTENENLDKEVPCEDFDWGEWLSSTGFVVDKEPVGNTADVAEFGMRDHVDKMMVDGTPLDDRPMIQIA